MTRFFIWLIVAAMSGALIYAYIQQSGSLNLPGTDVHERAEKAIDFARIDVSGFGGTTVTLEKGEGEEKIGEGATETISVWLGKPRAVAIKGDDADVYGIVSISGGGTGIFYYLAQFEFTSADGAIRETDRVMIGDRIEVDDVKVEFTAPTEYQILVSIRDRKPGEAMAAEPTEPRVMHFKRSDDGLVLSAFTFGTMDKPEVILFSPLEGDIAPTFTVTGAARGPWFFEANLPIRLKTLDGEELAVVGAQAQGEWMTEELVPFTGVIVAPNTAHGPHVLVIAKDNPSGLPENDKSYEFLVTLK